MKAGSAWVVAELRWEARGVAIASGRLMSRSIFSTRICKTVVMIVAPPAAPTARNGRPWWRTIVGDMLERGRLPPAGGVGAGAPGAGGAEAKTGRSLFRREPRPRTTTPPPPRASILFV